MFSKLLQSSLTLCDPMDCSPPGFFVHGILQARLLEWVAIPFSRGSSWPRDRNWSPASPALAGRFFTTGAAWMYIYIYIYIYICIDKSARIESEKDKYEEWIHRIFFNIGIYYRAIKIQAIACDELLAHQHYLLFILFYLLFLYL